MKRISLSLLALVCSADLWALGEHELNMAGRMRMAHIDGNNDGKSASVLLRTNVISDWTNEFGSTLEIDGIATAFNDDFSNGIDQDVQPLIPDVKGVEVNQAFITATGETLAAKLGRQRINFDNQRFVGGNGFWQNEQTFDALAGTAKIASNSHFSYHYVMNVNRIFGDDAERIISDSNQAEPGDTQTYPNGVVTPGGQVVRPLGRLGDHQHSTHLSRLEWNEWDYQRLVVYGHRIRNLDWKNDSNTTLGLAYHWNYKSGLIKYRVDLEAAQQKRLALNVDKLPYYLADLGMGIKTWELGTRYELLGARQGAAFITPLGSVHDFEGWADEIESAPKTGVRNFSLGLLWRASPWRVETSHHWFSDDVQGEEIGREWDLDIVFKPKRKHSISLRYAHFEPPNNTQSIAKVFLDYAYNL